MTISDELEKKLKANIDDYFELSTNESILDGHFSSTQLRTIADAMDLLKSVVVKCLSCGKTKPYLGIWSMFGCECGKPNLIQEIVTNEQSN